MSESTTNDWRVNRDGRQKYYIDIGAEQVGDPKIKERDAERARTSKQDGRLGKMRRREKK